MAALIEACWSEYPGCVMDLDGENPHLRALATHDAGQGGALLVAEADGRLVGTVSPAVAGEGVLELEGLHVDRAWRGTGLAQALLAGVEAFARRRGDRRLVLWSATRFGRAHRFYVESPAHRKCDQVGSPAARIPFIGENVSMRIAAADPT